MRAAANARCLSCRCGFITPTQAQAYNNGSIALRESVSELLRINANYSSPADFGGMLYADGLSNGMKCPISKNDENPDGSVPTIRSPLYGLFPYNP